MGGRVLIFAPIAAPVFARITLKRVNSTSRFIAIAVQYWRPAGSRVSEFSARNNLGNTVGGYADSSGEFPRRLLHGSAITDGRTSQRGKPQHQLGRN